MSSTDTPLWKDANAAVADRVSDVLERLTLEEKVSLLHDKFPGVERIGLPHFAYGGEALHGLCNTGRATSFPMPIGMAATFDPELVERIASATSDEMRAKFHDEFWRRSPKVTLLVYSPVINILRDPRWGRAQETFGEDPVLTARMGCAFVRGLQGDDPRYLKLAACAKHLGVHSGPESERTRFNAVTSRKDLLETYLYAFGELVDAGAASVMATYNRVNGEHCCAHSVLIGDFLRGRHHYEGVVLSDGGALGSLHKQKAGENVRLHEQFTGHAKGHDLTEDQVETAGLCLSQQLDLELGQHAFPRAAEALGRGLITEATIDRAVRRVLALQCRLGHWDDLSAHPYANIPCSVIQCPEHIALARESARKSLVLLKNADDALPLRRERDNVVLVTGPTSIDLQILLGNFYKGSSGKLVSLLEGITGAAPDGVTITHSQGAFLTHPNIFDSNWYLGLTEWADAVVACVGFSPLMEGEQGECIGAPDGGDKSSIQLPENQLKFLRQLREKLDADPRKLPLVVVVTGGCPLELEEVHEMADALLLAWYPGEEGGNAVGDILWGHAAPGGKLPATFPRRLEDLPPFADYALRGRTYRYQEAPALYPFGYGMSYTTFSLADAQANLDSGTRTIAVSVRLKNTGAHTGEEVVQLYARWPGVAHVPQCALKAFERVALDAGAEATVELRVPLDELRPYGEDGERLPDALEVELVVSDCSPVAAVFGSHSEQPLAIRVRLPQAQ
ncbi:MAG: glycoside hydrolase family 3 C-terminal domain-containing protein [Opitutales bacterium]